MNRTHLLDTILMGDRLTDGGLVLSTQPYFLTSDGYTILDGVRIPLNPTHQIYVYLDNLHGSSCYRPAFLYNGNTLAGLYTFLLQRLPNAAGVEIGCWDKAPGHYNRKRCGPVFGFGETEAHILFRERTSQESLTPL